MNVNIGDVYGDWTVQEIGSWASSKFYLCAHICGGTRKFQLHELEKKKKACKRCEARQSYRQNSETIIIGSQYRTYKWSAKKRGYDFELSKEEFSELVLGNCAYCGTPPINARQINAAKRSVWHEGETVMLNGVDRVDNSRGYTLDNVVTACTDCNYAKRDKTTEEFMAWLERIALKYAARA